MPARHVRHIDQKAVRQKCNTDPGAGYANQSSPAPGAPEHQYHQAEEAPEPKQPCCTSKDHSPERSPQRKGAIVEMQMRVPGEIYQDKVQGSNTGERQSPAETFRAAPVLHQ